MRLYTILNKLSTLVSQHTEQISSLNSKLGDLASGTDLDTVISAGHYQIIGGSSYVNSPTSYGVLEVICPRRSGNLILIQRITTLSVIFVRYRDADGSWKDWKKITMDAV